MVTDLKVDNVKHFSQGRIYFNGLKGFWDWAKERLIKHHGVAHKNLPLYLKGLAFRYNNKFLLKTYFLKFAQRQNDSPLKTYVYNFEQIMI